ncbi:MAG: hypothetical protein JW891_01075 [Candidatus Lokiarchaeota archaeon]|nr:hypothetical protein [Candidatus Lokiarchaeota archaeon]
MMESQSYRRWPAIRCWVKHILEGKYSEENKTLYTIFGETKRIRLLATIIKKSEKITTQNTSEDDFSHDEGDQNLRMEFELDDGTGIIRAVIWNANPEEYQDYKEGYIVDIVGLIQYWNGFNYIRPEIIKKINNPNFVLLRDAEIIKKIKSGNTREIPDISQLYDDIDEIPDDIDVEQLFGDESSVDGTDMKNLVFSLIEKHEKGMSFRDLNTKLKISTSELKNILRDLEMESRIYQSDEGIYQSF